MQTHNVFLFLFNFDFYLFSNEIQCGISSTYLIGLVDIIEIIV